MEITKVKHDRKFVENDLVCKQALLPSQAFTSTKLEIDFLFIIELNSAVTEEKLVRECIAFTRSI